MPRTPQEFYLTLGGRRFFMAMGAGVSATLLQWFGKMDPSGTAYATIVIATVAAYITGATHEAVKNGKE